MPSPTIPFSSSSNAQSNILFLTVLNILYNSLLEEKNSNFVGKLSEFSFNQSAIFPLTDELIVAPLHEVYKSCIAEIDVGIGILEISSAISADTTTGIQP